MKPASPLARTSLGATVSALLLVMGASSLLALPAEAQTCGTWVPVAPPTGATLAVTDVRARGASEAYAFATPLGLVRWDGASWTQFPLGNVSGGYSTLWIRSFGLVGPSHLFLMGNGSTGPASSDVLLKSWDGSSWSSWSSLTLQPNASGGARNGAANAVVGVAPNDVWLLGNASSFGPGVGGPPILTVHWDGSQLTEHVTPGIGNYSNQIAAGVAVASNDVWAVGTSRNTSGPDPHFHGATYHWDGTSWSPIPNPSQLVPSTLLYAIDAVASNDVWAAGVSGNQPLFMHWDGNAWSIVPSPPTTGTIQGLAAIATDDVWAVDSPAQVPTISKYYHWDGNAWRIVTPPAVPGATGVSRHGGLAATGPCDVWAVGSFQDGTGLHPFVERLQAHGAGDTSYCTAGTTVNGCRATLSATGSASVSAGSGFVVTASGVEGQKNGLLFYGINGRLSTPWGIGGTSLLCVKAPTQRTPVQGSGGTTGACDGSLSLDWNAYFAAHPTKPIHQAIAPGAVVDLQAWFRDPGSPRNTSLSDGYEFTVRP